MGHAAINNLWVNLSGCFSRAPTREWNCWSHLRGGWPPVSWRGCSNLPVYQHCVRALVSRVLVNTWVCPSFHFNHSGRTVSHGLTCISLMRHEAEHHSTCLRVSPVVKGLSPCPCVYWAVHMIPLDVQEHFMGSLHKSSVSSTTGYVQ